MMTNWRPFKIVCYHKNHRGYFWACEDHLKYNAIRRPRVNCEDCWRLYIYTHPQGDCFDVSLF